MVLGINKNGPKLPLTEALDKMVGEDLDRLQTSVANLGKFLLDKSSLEKVVADKKANYARIPEVKALIISYGHEEQEVASVLKTYFDARK